MRDGLVVAGNVRVCIRIAVWLVSPTLVLTWVLGLAVGLLTAVEEE